MERPLFVIHAKQMATGGVKLIDGHGGIFSGITKFVRSSIGHSSLLFSSVSRMAAYFTLIP